MPSYIRYFTFSPRHALMLTHAMCVCPILVHYCALLVTYSIAKTWVVDQYPHIVQPPICSSLYALLLTQAMCTVIFLHSIANLSCRPVPTHYTTANMLFTVVLFRYVTSLCPTVHKLYCCLKWLCTTDIGSPCHLCFAVVSLLYFTVPNVYSVVTVCCAVKLF